MGGTTKGLAMSGMHAIPASFRALEAPIARPDAADDRIWTLGHRYLHRRPILLVGAPRTGTSWAAQGLSFGRGTRYVREPISATLNDGFVGANSFRYLRAGDPDPSYAAAWRQALSPRNLLARRWLMGQGPRRLARLPLLPARLVVKEVNCPLALEWLAARLPLSVVVTVRHPCGYVASALRLRKVGHPVIELPRLLDQPALMADHFAADRDWLLGLRDPVARLAAAYAMAYRVVAAQLRRHPDWLLARHEDLCADPVGGFDRLYRGLGLRRTAALAEFLARSTRSSDGELYSTRRRSAAEPRKWEAELSTAQIDAIEETVGRLGLPYYPEFA